MEASHILGTSQEDLENNYYMKDVADLVERKIKQENAEFFLQFQMMLASNNRFMEEESYGEFVRNLTKNLESSESDNKANKLDRQAFEALRFMANQGANRTGGN